MDMGWLTASTEVSSHRLGELLYSNKNKTKKEKHQSDEEWEFDSHRFLQKNKRKEKKKQQLFAAFGFTLEYVSFIGLFIGFKVRDLFSSYLL